MSASAFPARQLRCQPTKSIFSFMTAPSATSPVQRAQPCDWLAVLLLLGFAFLQLYYLSLIHI